MVRKFFVLVFVLMLSNSAWSAQRALRAGIEELYNGLHNASKCTPVQARFFSSTPPVRAKQIYTIPTYDAAFKWVLSDDSIRPSFFHAFIPGVNIRSSERLDEHMNPIETLQTLRDFLHKDTTLDTVRSLSGSGSYVVRSSSPGKTAERDDAATAFLMEMVGRFDEIKISFPKRRFDGKMDFVCRLDNNDYALVEMQVIPQDYWDRRALAYVAAFYGNQLSRGQSWNHIRRVIGVNILGGGKEDIVHWSDTPGHFTRHYKFEDQLNGKGRFIDGIELIQYSIMKAPTVDDQEKQDWITFFREARYMSEEDVRAKIKTPAVLQAFERAKISKLPTDVQEAYEAEDKEYDRYSQHTKEQIEKAIKKYSQHTADLVTKGKIEVLEEVAKNMIKSGKSVKEVSEMTGLSKEQIDKLNP